MSLKVFILVSQPERFNNINAKLLSNEEKNQQEVEKARLSYLYLYLYLLIKKYY